MTRRLSQPRRPAAEWVLRPGAPSMSPGKTAVTCYTWVEDGVHNLSVSGNPRGAQEHPATDFDALFHRFFAQPQCKKNSKSPQIISSRYDSGIRDFEAFGDHLVAGWAGGT